VQLKLYRAGQDAGRGTDLPDPRAGGKSHQRGLISGAENRRADVLAKVVARIARRDPDVMAFRQSHLRGDLVAPEDVTELLSSAVLRVIPLERLDRLGIPLLGHRVRATTYLRPGRPGEGQVRVRGARVSWPNGSVTLRMPPVTLVRHEREVASLLCGARGAQPRRVFSRPFSFLDDARILAGRLAKRYSWRESEAAWFLLTDDHPPYDSVLIDLSDPEPPSRPDGQIALRVRPWVSAVTVARAYRSCQRILLRQRMRGISKEKLDLFEFVESHRPPPPRPPNWPRLFDRWRLSSRFRREAPPRTWRQFQRDFGRVKKMILRPEPRQMKRSRRLPDSSRPSQSRSARPPSPR
jgi:hypothetical protein